MWSVRPTPAPFIFNIMFTRNELHVADLSTSHSSRIFNGCRAMWTLAMVQLDSE